MKERVSLTKRVNDLDQFPDPVVACGGGDWSSDMEGASPVELIPFGLFETAEDVVAFAVSGGGVVVVNGRIAKGGSGSAPFSR